MDQPENDMFHGVWIKPQGNFRGNHVIASNGEWAFDYHGYSKVDRLLDHFRKGQLSNQREWKADYVTVDFDLLNMKHLNERNMRGPDQYLKDPSERAAVFIQRFKKGRCKVNV